jgi:hypothetical protein
MVEATRVGTVFASNVKAYRKWANAKRTRRPGRGLTGDALERAVMGVARQFPGNVLRGAA